MATLIFILSALALLQFFISYCRSLIAACIRQPLSAEVRDVTGIPNTAAGEDFARVIQLLDLCPERPEERGQFTYFAAVTLDRRIAFSRDMLAQQIDA